MKTDKSLSEQVMNLLAEQKKEWEALRKGYESLASVKTKEILFDSFSFTVQYNPQRITSTSAKTDAASIKERKCFLCTENRPVEQRGIEKDNFLILCNPFPVFTEHLTITCKEHTPQRIKNNFTPLLKFAEYFQNDLAVFYNGPECGASAPDHMHFQAGTLNELPLLVQLNNITEKYANKINLKTLRVNSTSVYAVNDGLRKMLLLKGSDLNELEALFNNLYSALDNIKPAEENSTEPKLNIIACYRKEWEVVVFLREKHRPVKFFYEGEEKLTFSPAAIDTAGLCITPLEKDFLRMDKDLLTDCFKQVFISDEKFSNLTQLLSK